MTRNVLKSSIHGASISIIFQILCRCITFAINSFVIRIVDRNVLGIMNVRLLLLESTLLFLSREAIRKASLSSTRDPSNRKLWPQIVNQLWLTAIICVLFSLPCLYIWLNLLSSVGDELYTQYKFGCLSIILSCIIETLAETPIFVAQVFCFVKLKVVLDTLHIFVRSVLFIWLVLRDPSHSIYAFSIAQVGSSIAFVIGYYGYFHYVIRTKENRIEQRRKSCIDMDENEQNDERIPFHSIMEFVPIYLPNSGTFFNNDLQSLVWSFFKQGLLKQILTEGEKYVMSVSPILTFHQQATYDIVNNLGSLFARFVFRPIEENSYFYFTQTISREEPLKKQNKDKVKQASLVLYNLLKVVTSIGLIGLIFGQSYSRTVLTIYGGEKFVGDGLSVLLLRWHSVAIILLAINGISEGYMFATMTSDELNRYNYLMGCFSITFLALSYQLTTLFGPVGFVLANCTNMLLRIIYSGIYIKKEYKNVQLNPLEGIIPKKIFLICLVVFGISCKASEIYFLKFSMISHILIGAISFGVVLGSWSYENQKLIKSYFRNRRRDSENKIKIK